MTQKNKGVCCILLSSFSFALMNMFVRMSGDLPSIQKSFFRNFVAMLFALSILLKEKPEIRLDWTSKKFLLLRSLCGRAYHYVRGYKQPYSRIYIEKYKKEKI